MVILADSTVSDQGFHFANSICSHFSLVSKSDSLIYI